MNTELIFGDRLKEIRIERGLSQEEFAELLGTTKQVISRYETNQRTPKITVVNSFAEKLAIPIGRLLGWEDVNFYEGSTGIVDAEDELKSLLSRLNTASEIKYNGIKLDDATNTLLKNSIEGLIQTIELIVKKQ